MARSLNGGAASPALRPAIAVCLGMLILTLVGSDGDGQEQGAGAPTTSAPAKKLPRNALPKSAAGKRAAPATQPAQPGARAGGERVLPKNALPRPRKKIGDVLNRGNPFVGDDSPAPPSPHRANPRHHAGRDPHAGWIHGNWDGKWGSNHRWDWEGIATRAVAAGLTSWRAGSTVDRWGDTPYSNPYNIAPAAAGSFDYSRPLDTESPAPAPATTDFAVALLDEARAAFKAGDYPKTLGLTDRVLKTLPHDSAVHELRALALFALKRYDPAAAALHAILSVGPGWDWTTMIRLYPEGDAYTGQLRALESYRDDHPDSAAAHFVLAYHYLTAGHVATAEEELKEATRLKPQDHLTGQLIVLVSPTTRGAEGVEVATAPLPGPAIRPAAARTVAALTPATATPSAITAPTPATTMPPATATPSAVKPANDDKPAQETPAEPRKPANDDKPAQETPAEPRKPANDDKPIAVALKPETEARRTPKSRPPPPSMADLAGTWKANPTKDVTIELAFYPDRKFTWTVTGSQGTGRTLTGEFTYGGEALALVQTNGTSMVGWLAWEDENHFHFRIAGSIPDHPRLKFSR